MRQMLVQPRENVSMSVKHNADKTLSVLIRTDLLVTPISIHFTWDHSSRTSQHTVEGDNNAEPCNIKQLLKEYEITCHGVKLLLYQSGEVKLVSCLNQKVFLTLDVPKKFSIFDRIELKGLNVIAQKICINKVKGQNTLTLNECFDFNATESVEIDGLICLSHRWTPEKMGHGKITTKNLILKLNSCIYDATRSHKASEETNKSQWEINIQVDDADIESNAEICVDKLIMIPRLRLENKGRTGGNEVTIKVNTENNHNTGIIYGLNKLALLGIGLLSNTGLVFSNRLFELEAKYINKNMAIAETIVLRSPMIENENIIFVRHMCFTTTAQQQAAPYQKFHNLMKAIILADDISADKNKYELINNGNVILLQDSKFTIDNFKNIKTLAIDTSTHHPLTEISAVALRYLKEFLKRQHSFMLSTALREKIDQFSQEIAIYQVDWLNKFASLSIENGAHFMSRAELTVQCNQGIVNDCNVIALGATELNCHSFQQQSLGLVHGKQVRINCMQDFTNEKDGLIRAETFVKCFARHKFVDDGVIESPEKVRVRGSDASLTGKISARKVRFKTNKFEHSRGTIQTAHLVIRGMEKQTLAGFVLLKAALQAYDNSSGLITDIFVNVANTFDFATRVLNASHALNILTSSSCIKHPIDIDGSLFLSSPNELKNQLMQFSAAFKSKKRIEFQLGENILQLNQAGEHFQHIEAPEVEIHAQNLVMQRCGITGVKGIALKLLNAGVLGKAVNDRALNIDDVTHLLRSGDWLAQSHFAKIKNIKKLVSDGSYLNSNGDISIDAKTVDLLLSVIYSLGALRGSVDQITNTGGGVYVRDLTKFKGTWIQKTISCPVNSNGPEQRRFESVYIQTPQPHIFAETAKFSGKVINEGIILSENTCNYDNGLYECKNVTAYDRYHWMQVIEYGRRRYANLFGPRKKMEQHFSTPAYPAQTHDKPAKPYLATITSNQSLNFARSVTSIQNQGRMQAPNISSQAPQVHNKPDDFTRVVRREFMQFNDIASYFDERIELFKQVKENDSSIFKRPDDAEQFYNRLKEDIKHVIYLKTADMQVNDNNKQLFSYELQELLLKRALLDIFGRAYVTPEQETNILVAFWKKTHLAAAKIPRNVENNNKYMTITQQEMDKVLHELLVYHQDMWGEANVPVLTPFLYLPNDLKKAVEHQPVAYIRADQKLEFISTEPGSAILNMGVMEGDKVHLSANMVEQVQRTLHDNQTAYLNKVNGFVSVSVSSVDEFSAILKGRYCIEINGKKFIQIGGEVTSGVGGTFVEIEEVILIRAQKETQIMQGEKRSELGCNYAIKPHFVQAKFSSEGKQLLIVTNGGCTIAGIHSYAKGDNVIKASGGINIVARTEKFNLPSTQSSTLFTSKSSSGSAEIAAENVLASDQNLMLSSVNDVIASAVYFRAQGNVDVIGRNVKITEESLQTQLKNSETGFSGFSFGNVTRKQNSTSAMLSTASIAGSLRITAEENILLSGLQGAIGGDMKLKAGKKCEIRGAVESHHETIDSHSIGISFFGSQAIDALINGERGHDIFSKLCRDIPFCNALYELSEANDVGTLTISSIKTFIETISLASMAQQAMSTKSPMKDFCGALTDKVGLTRVNEKGVREFSPEVTFSFKHYHQESSQSREIGCKLNVLGTFSIIADEIILSGGSKIKACDIILMARKCVIHSGKHIFNVKSQQYGTDVVTRPVNGEVIGGNVNYHQSSQSTTQVENTELKANTITADIKESIEIKGAKLDAVKIFLKTKVLHLETLPDTASSRSIGGSVGASLLPGAVLPKLSFEYAKGDRQQANSISTIRAEQLLTIAAERIIQIGSLIDVRGGELNVAYLHGKPLFATVLESTPIDALQREPHLRSYYFLEGQVAGQPFETFYTQLNISATDIKTRLLERASIKGPLNALLQEAISAEINNKYTYYNWYNDQDILAVLNQKIRQIPEVTDNRNFMIVKQCDSKFTDIDRNSYYVLVTDAIDTQEIAASIDCYLDKLKQVAPVEGMRDDRRDVFDQINRLLANQDELHIKILFPYNTSQVHWLTGEIKLHRNQNSHHYTIQLVAHDPYGGGRVTEENYAILCLTLKRKIEESDPTATFSFENLTSIYLPRQDMNDHVSCGVIVVEDIIKRVKGESLQLDHPYPMGAHDLRSNHLQLIDRAYPDDNPIKRIFFSHHQLFSNKLFNSDSQAKSLCVAIAKLKSDKLDPADYAQQHERINNDIRQYAENSVNIRKFIENIFAYDPNRLIMNSDLFDALLLVCNKPVTIWRRNDAGNNLEKILGDDQNPDSIHLLFKGNGGFNRLIKTNDPNPSVSWTAEDLQEWDNYEACRLAFSVTDAKRSDIAMTAYVKQQEKAALLRSSVFAQTITGQGVPAGINRVPGNDRIETSNKSFSAGIHIDTKAFREIKKLLTPQDEPEVQFTQKDAQKNKTLPADADEVVGEDISKEEDEKYELYKHFLKAKLAQVIVDNEGDVVPEAADFIIEKLLAGNPNNFGKAVDEHLQYLKSHDARFKSFLEEYQRQSVSDLPESSVGVLWSAVDAYTAVVDYTERYITYHMQNQDDNAKAVPEKTHFTLAELKHRLVESRKIKKVGKNLYQDMNSESGNKFTSSLFSGKKKAERRNDVELGKVEAMRLAKDGRVSLATADGQNEIVLRAKVDVEVDSGDLGTQFGGIAECAIEKIKVADVVLENTKIQGEKLGGELRLPYASLGIRANDHKFSVNAVTTATEVKAHAKTPELCIKNNLVQLIGEVKAGIGVGFEFAAGSEKNKTNNKTRTTIGGAVAGLVKLGLLAHVDFVPDHPACKNTLLSLPERENVAGGMSP